MCQGWKILIAGLMLGILTGCPAILPQDVTFTNARSGQYSWDTTVDNGTGDTSADEETDSETPRDVVEPDVIRRSGNRLFVLNQYRGLILVDLASQQILSETPTIGYPRDLYLTGDRAYVLVSNASKVTTQGNLVSWEIVSRLYVVDISVETRPVILSSFDLSGDLVDSRLVGNVLYAVCAEYDWAVTDNTAKVTKTKSSSSWVTSVNVADPANVYKADEVSFSTLGEVIQATDSALFVSGTNSDGVSSTITYVDIHDPAGIIAVKDAISIAGTVADQYKMDAYQGILRVVSASGSGSERKVHVSTIDLANPEALVLLKSVQIEAAAGESLFATRFDGTRAYIVTYLTQDPLFVVDLADPANPVFAGQLTVPGWSTHIEPQGDRLIALGVDDADGRKVSVSLFNVSDPANPTLLDRKTFGDTWSWSSAYGDVDAFTVLDNVLIVPFSGYTDTTGGYERLQFLSYDQNSLTLGGYVDVSGEVQRSFEYDHHYYGVTTEQLAMIDGTDLANPTVTARLTFAEYTSDYLELNPDRFARIVTQYDTNTTIVRTQNAAGDVLGSVEVPGYANATTFVHGETVVLVRSDWDVYIDYLAKQNKGNAYHVAQVDCSDPSTPTFSEMEVSVPPFWGYYLYDTSVAAVNGVSISQFGWYASNETMFLTGDTLVLRTQNASWDVTLGTETATQGLALVNLTDASVTKIGLGYAGITTVNVTEGNAYIGTCQNVGLNLIFPLCANYLRVLDLETHAISGAVNIPGTFLQYSPETGILLVNDTQWKDTGSLSTALQTVHWVPGGDVTAVSKLDLPSGTNRILPRNTQIVYDEYNSNGYALHTARLSADGSLADGVTIQSTGQTGYLLNASSTTAYVPIENTVLVYDLTGTGALTGCHPVMGYPSAIRFGSEQAYAILGYSGILALPD